MKALVFTLIIIELVELILLILFRIDYKNFREITKENIKTLVEGLKNHSKTINGNTKRIDDIETSISDIKDALNKTQKTTKNSIQKTDYTSVINALKKMNE